MKKRKKAAEEKVEDLKAAVKTETESWHAALVSDKSAEEVAEFNKGLVQAVKLFKTKAIWAEVAHVKKNLVDWTARVNSAIRKKEIQDAKMKIANQKVVARDAGNAAAGTQLLAALLSLIKDAVPQKVGVAWQLESDHVKTDKPKAVVLLEDAM